MHVLAETIRTLDDTVQAVDLAQTPAETVFLSFTDSDLSIVASVAETLAAPEVATAAAPSLRLASLADLRHPFSVDTHVDMVARHAKLVVVRLLGGLDYWRYGVEELAASARRHGFALAVVPGDYREDPRLDAASTVPIADLRRIWGWFQHGGPDNIRSFLAWMAEQVRPTVADEPTRRWRDPAPLPAFGLPGDLCREPTSAFETSAAAADAPRALVLFYRSILAAGDTAPIAALAEALAARGFTVDAAFVTSLKDPVAVEALAAHLDRHLPTVILNTTAFSAKLDDGTTVLDRADVPVIQAILSTATREAWETSNRGIGAADLAMNAVLPEVDGRIVARAISFKARQPRSEAFEFARLTHAPETDGVAAVADLAQAWARLGRTPRSERKLALVLSDYPAKGGRAAYAVGLDGPASIGAIAEDLASAGYRATAIGDPQDLIRRLEAGLHTIRWPLAAYHAAFATLPEPFRASVAAAWGEPEADPACDGDAFALSVCEAGHLTIAVQPDRGARATRKGDYHDPTRPPRHGYVAFYLWLRMHARIDAMIHLGTHGTLEWLPGKAVALSNACAPAALIGATPVVYPFIVNNPGEACQAKRRIAAVTLGHLTPPLARAGSHGATEEIEAMLDEFAAAQTMDARRAKRLAETILARAVETGLAEECGLDPAMDQAAALARLDAWMCDLKDMRIGDGLHVFGRAPEAARLDETVAALAETPEIAASLRERLAASANAERDALIAALDGRFIAPGPAGAPTRGRIDVLPTGRNLYTVDPRAVPTPTAWEIGRRTAEEVIARYVQDHGDWPRRIVVDLWGSATMRTGGDELAQAFALLGVRPRWDAASARVSGLEVIAPARLGRPRVDVTLRVSGLFRDVFPAQITLFDEAARTVAALEEDAETNPLAASVRAGDADTLARVFGAAPGAYGIGLATRIATGDWTDRAELGDAYLAATTHAFGADGDRPAAGAFAAQVATADAFVHVQDMAGQDVLDSDAFAEHEGGFAAAADRLGNAPALYHVDATRPEAPKVRGLAEEVARVVRARATNPRWIAGQMRHGHRGAAEIAETVGNLVAFSATADAVGPRQYDLVFDATLGDDRVRDFLVAANPAAARAVARAFDEALRRGLWASRRNSVRGRIDEVLGTAA
ncbi:cobaltochelatase subunit CobN [Methyloraptor flagellatus]|uniref:Cobaltochelatase subunit CobN n=1 Tax=Methyloraptor flagellatus TaxID=3162530 RepID=A0AAU7X8N0_9HYPH